MILLGLFAIVVVLRPLPEFYHAVCDEPKMAENAVAAAKQGWLSSL